MKPERGTAPARPGRTQATTSNRKQHTPSGYVTKAGRGCPAPVGSAVPGFDDRPSATFTDALVVAFGVTSWEAARFGCEPPHAETIDVIRVVAERDTRRRRSEILLVLLAGEPLDSGDVPALVKRFGWPSGAHLIDLGGLAGAALDEVTAARRALLVAELSGAPPEGTRRVLLRELAALEVTPWAS